MVWRSKNIEGVRTLCQGNNPVQSVTIEEALRNFLTFITHVKTSEPDQHNNHVTVLIPRDALQGHRRGKNPVAYVFFIFIFLPRSRKKQCLILIEV